MGTSEESTFHPYRLAKLKARNGPLFPISGLKGTRHGKACMPHEVRQVSQWLLHGALGTSRSGMILLPYALGGNVWKGDGGLPANREKVLGEPFLTDGVRRGSGSW